MNWRLRRRLAEGICAAIAGALPPQLHRWGCAIRNEVHSVQDDGTALRFALGSLWGLLPRSLLFLLLQPFIALVGGQDTPGGKARMSFFDDLAHRPGQSVPLAR